MTDLDQAKQLLYLEENRAYRNAFKLDWKPVEAAEAENMSPSTQEPVLDECCEDFNSRVSDRSFVVQFNGS